MLFIISSTLIYEISLQIYKYHHIHKFHNIWVKENSKISLYLHIIILLHLYIFQYNFRNIFKMKSLMYLRIL